MVNGKLAPDIQGVRLAAVIRPMKMSGNRGTRNDNMPRNKVTVWAGTSWLKATRKDIWSGMVPLIVVNVQSSFRVRVNMEIRSRKHKKLGISDVTTRNLANSLEDQALSRYLPPLKSVMPAMTRLVRFSSTRVVVRKVHG